MVEASESSDCGKRSYDVNNYAESNALVSENNQNENKPDNDNKSDNGHYDETYRQFINRHVQNIIHFFVEDWFLSAVLGVVTAILSISVDVSYEYIIHFRSVVFNFAQGYGEIIGLTSWVAHFVALVTAATLFCRFVSVQAIGSGIPEVKVIMNGFMLKNYLSFRTLIAKVVSLTLALGSGIPIGKEGPFVHMGAIVASLLSKITKNWQSNVFFSNEGRELEILASGCAVGVACTFSSPAGAVLYGIESTHKYFAVKNYWRSFFATTCSALIFRFANAAIIPHHIAGTITAYYQTEFPNEVFLIEEIPAFVLVGVISGLLGAFFVILHRQISNFRKNNRVYLAIFGRNNYLFTIVIGFVVAITFYPHGFGKYIAGQLIFRESLSNFISNCSMSLSTEGNATAMRCGNEILSHYVTDSSMIGNNIPNVFPILFGFFFVNYFLVAVCNTLAVPYGIFIPSFVLGACEGRIIGEIMVLLFPEGIRGLGGPQIYPGLYAVVGAAAYTGAVTHSLSIAVIVCETTGQLCALLPVLIALMVANAIASFLQPSIYESVINIKKYPHLAELPPSRISVHTLKVEQIMVRNVVYITRHTTYKDLRKIIGSTHYRSYPIVTNDGEKILIGSVSRKYLQYILTTHLGADPILSLNNRHRSTTSSEIFSSFRTNSQHSDILLNDRNVSGSTLLSNSPLHDDYNARSPLVPLLMRQTQCSEVRTPANSSTIQNRIAQLHKPIDLDDVAIDAAPFQLVQGTSLYKVHTLFSLLGLNHAYVTHRGFLIGVVSLKELRIALSKIYTRGALPSNHSYPLSVLPSTSLSYQHANQNQSMEGFFPSCSSPTDSVGIGMETTDDESVNLINRRNVVSKNLKKKLPNQQGNSRNVDDEFSAADNSDLKPSKKNVPPCDEFTVKRDD